MQICEKGAGAALLTRPRRLEDVVRSAAAVASTCALTFKTRTAYYKQAMAHTLLPHAGKWGACAVTLHGRTREQRYARLADWDYIGEVADAMPEDVQLIGNGDVFSFEEYEAHTASGKVCTDMWFCALHSLLAPLHLLVMQVWQLRLLPVHAF